MTIEECLIMTKQIDDIVVTGDVIDDKDIRVVTVTAGLYTRITMTHEPTGCVSITFADDIYEKSQYLARIECKDNLMRMISNDKK